MAVILCREDGKGFPFSADLRNAPSVMIRNEPVPIPSHQGKKISARSDETYACAEPEREEVWRDAFERRKVQLSSCGFHGPTHRPYRDVGPVVLDDRRLILEGLGQGDGLQQTQAQDDDPLPEVSLPPSSLPPPVPPGGIQLRERMPSQFPTKLAGLEGEQRDGEARLEMVKKGHGLFKLMRDAETDKQSEVERIAQLERDGQCNAWKEADVAADISLRDDGTVLSRQPTAPESAYSQSKNKCDVTSDQAASGIDHTSQSAEWSREGVDEGGGRGEGTLEPTDVVYSWYRRLCVLVWILQAMKMESPSHMTPLSQCWRVEWTPPTEVLGKKMSDQSRTVTTSWDRMVREQKTPILHKRWRSAMKKVSHAASFGRTTSVTPEHKVTPSRDHMMSPATPKSGLFGESLPPAVKKKPKSGDDRVREVLRQRAVVVETAREDDRMKKQRKLTPAQLQQLETTVEEELNYSKKQSRFRIDALVRQADEARMQSDPAPSPPRVALPTVSLDVDSVRRRFSEAEERRKMIVHEQLTAMERDRHKALQQRFSSLQVSGNLWRDLRVMRSGVKIESTAMARRRLLMNYEWFPELLSRLPPEVHHDRYCQRLLASLDDLSQYMVGVGPARMSKRRLIAVLATLRPWELRSPEISTAVEFLITRVIYIVQEDYEAWLHHHSLTPKTRTTATPART